MSTAICQRELSIPRSCSIDSDSAGPLLRSLHVEAPSSVTVRQDLSFMHELADPRDLLGQILRFSPPTPVRLEGTVPYVL
jgi:hypothetical protein